MFASGTAGPGLYAVVIMGVHLLGALFLRLFANTARRQLRSLRRITRLAAYLPLAILQGFVLSHAFHGHAITGEDWFAWMAVVLVFAPWTNFILDRAFGLSEWLRPLVVKVRHSPAAIILLEVSALVLVLHGESTVALGLLIYPLVCVEFLRLSGQAWRQYDHVRDCLNLRTQGVLQAMARFEFDLARAKDGLQQIPGVVSAAPIVMMGEHGLVLLGHRFTTASGRSGWQFVDPTFGTVVEANIMVAAMVTRRN